MPVSTETIMDILEKAIPNPADRWKALRGMLRINKNNVKPQASKPKAKRSKSKAKRGRPPKTEEAK